MRSLKITPEIYHWCKAGGNRPTVSDLATQSLTLYALNIYVRKSFTTQPSLLLSTLQIIRSHLIYLLNDKAVDLPIRITFKRIDIRHGNTKIDSFLPQKFCGVKCVCYQESLLIPFLPTSLLAPVSLAVTDMGPLAIPVAREGGRQ